MRNIKKSVVAAVATIVIAGIALPARAGIVLGEANTINFQNREQLVDADSDGSLSGGDRIYGVLYANTIESTSATQNPVTPEISAVFDITVAHVVALDGAMAGTSIDPTAGAGYTGNAIVLFNPTGAGGFLAGASAGTALQIWEGGASTVSSINDGIVGLPGQLATIAAASDGTHIADFGFSSTGTDPGDWGDSSVGYWAAEVFYSGGVSDTTADIYYGLNYLGGVLEYGFVQSQNEFSLSENANFDEAGTLISDNDVGGPTAFDFVGLARQETNDNVGLSQGTTVNDQAEWLIYSQDPATTHPNAPEPGSIVLALIGACCAAPFVRRRQSKKQGSTM